MGVVAEAEEEEVETRAAEEAHRMTVMALLSTASRVPTHALCATRERVSSWTIRRGNAGAGGIAIAVEERSAMWRRECAKTLHRVDRPALALSNGTQSVARE